MSSNNLSECEYCHTHTSGWKNWETHILCEHHFEEATANPNRFRNYFAYLNRGKQAKKSPEKTLPKQETDRPTAYKESGNAVPKSPYVLLPVQTLVSMPFQSRNVPDDSELGELAENLRALGFLQPIIVRQKASGLYEIVAGERRVKAAKKAGIIEVPALVKVLSDEEAAIVQLTENIQRKDLSEEEKTRALSELAKKTGWKAQQIADHLKMSYTWVVKYLPEEFKDREMAELGKAGGESKAETVATRHVAEESQETRQESPRSVPCVECGGLTSNPISTKDGKLYCSEECKQDAEAKAASDTGEVSAEEPEKETTEEPAKPSEKPAKPEPLLTGYPWTCPDCGAKLIINHVDYPNSDKKEHRLEACGR